MRTFVQAFVAVLLVAAFVLPTTFAPPPAAAQPGTADLSLTKALDAGSPDTQAVAPGATYTHTLTVTNAGPDTAVNVAATDPLAADETFVSGDGCAVAGGNTVTCGPVAELPVGESHTWTVTVRLAPTYSGDGSDLAGTATVTSDTPDPNPGDNSAAATVPYAPEDADLSLQMSATPSVAAPGQGVVFDITLVNGGPSAASTVTVTDTLPPALAFVQGPAECVGTPGAYGGTVTCTYPNVPVGSTPLGIGVQVDPNAADGTTVTNQASVAGGNPDPNPANNTATADLQVSQQADLSVTKAPVGTTPVAPGGTFDYAITVTNAGPADATDVTVTDALPAGLAFVSSASGCTGPAGTYGATVTCGPTDTVGVQETASYAITVRLDPAYAGDGSDIANQAQVTASSPDPNPANNTSPAAGLPGGGPADDGPAGDGVTIEKWPASSQQVRPGENFDYYISVWNSGSATISQVTVSDVLPNGLTYVSRGSQCPASGQEVTCRFGSLRTNQGYGITIQVRLSPDYVEGTSEPIANVATLGYVDSAGVATGLQSAPAGLPGGAALPPLADLSATKTAVGSGPVTPGQTFQYQVTATNAGPSSAANVAMTDVLPAQLAFVSSEDGCQGTPGQYGGAVTCGPVATLSPDAPSNTHTWTMTVRIDPEYTGDGSDIGNVATVSADTEDPNADNNQSAPAGPPGGVVPGDADLSVTKAFAAQPAGPVVPGTPFAYDVTVTNNGTTVPARQVVVADQLPAATTFVSATDPASGASIPCTLDSGVLSCPLADSLAAGATATMRLTVQLDPAYTGTGSDITNTATVESATPDPNPDNNAATRAGVPGGVATPSADVAVTKAPAEDTPVRPGLAFDYRVTVSNAGPSVATNVTVTDLLPDALAFVSSADGCTGTAGEYGGSVNCGPLARLDPGSAGSWTFEVRLDPAYAGDGSDVVDQASVDSDTADPNPSNNTAEAGLPGGSVAESSADLSISKVGTPSGPVTPGGTFDYRVTVSNAGPSTARDVAITDPLPAQLAFVSSADGCTATEQYGGTVQCGPVAELSTGGSVTRTFTVRLDPSYTGDGSGVVNHASVTSTTADPDPSNNATQAGLPGPVGPASADVSVTKAPTSATPIVPGVTFDYRVSVSNAGPSTAANVAVTDVLPAALSLVSAGEGCAGTAGESGGTVTCGPQTSLAPGASAAWTFTVRLDPAYTGDGSDITNTASAVSPTPDPNPDNNTAEAGIPGGSVAKPSADLAVSKAPATSTPVSPGQTFDYRVTVSNAGPSAAANVAVTDKLPPALSFVSSDTGCQGTPGQYGGTVTCEPWESLEPGPERLEWHITVRVDPAYVGDGSDVVNTANVASDTADPNQANNTAQAGLPGGSVAASSADVAASKAPTTTTPVSPGQTFDYQVTATNAGPSAATNVAVTDVLPSALSLVSAGEGCTGKPGESGRTVTCGPRASLAPGATATWTFTVRLDPAYAGDGSDVVNTATVGSATVDPNPANNTTEAGLPGGSVAASSADVSITKAPTSATPVVPGGTFDYTVTVGNAGPSTATNVAVTDVLPAALSLVSAGQGCTGSPGESGGTVTCGPQAALAPGASAVWTFTVRLDPSYTGDGSEISNTATVGSDTPDPNVDNNTAEAGIPGGSVAEPSADLAVSKAATTTTPVSPGQTFAYQVTVTNAGPSTAANVTATDDLPPALSLVSADAGCAGTPGEYGGTVACGPQASLAPGATTTWTITVRLDPAYTGDGGDVVNSASVTSDTADPNPANNTAQAGVTGGVAAPSADLAVTKEPATAAPVAPGQTFDYQVTVSNAGPSTAANAAIEDSLPGQLAFVSGSGCTGQAGAYGGAVDCGPRASLAPGETATWTFTVRLDPAYIGDGSDVVNTATGGSDTADPDPTNNTAEAGLPGDTARTPSADLGITKAPGTTDDVAPGGTFDYVVKVGNAGPSTATNVAVEDALPDELAFVSSVDGACVGTPGEYGGVINCGPQASLAPGATATWTLTVQLDPSYTGDGSDVVNTATVGSDTADPNPANDTAEAGLPGAIAAGSADLAITKRPTSETPVAPGETFDYRLTVTNAGPSTATNVTVVDVLPTQLSFVSGGSCTGPAGEYAGVIHCGQRARLSPGDSVTWTFTVRLDPAYAGDGSDITNRATVDSETPDPDAENNTAEAGVPGKATAQPTADVAISKTPTSDVPVAPGQTFAYQITVTNAGPSTAVNVNAVDSLPEQLAFVESPACIGTPDEYGGDVHCGPQASLAPGATATWTLTVRLDPSYDGDADGVVNQATVTSDTEDSNQTNNLADAGLPGAALAPPIADLALTKTAQVPDSGLRPGDSFSYTVSVVNHGPSTATGVTVTDPLPSGLSLASSADDCTADGAQVTCGPAANLLPEQAESWTFVVRIDPTHPGGQVDNVATASGAQNDQNPDDNAASAVVTVNPPVPPSPNPPNPPNGLGDQGGPGAPNAAGGPAQPPTGGGQSPDDTVAPPLAMTGIPYLAWYLVAAAGVIAVGVALVAARASRRGDSE